MDFLRDLTFAPLLWLAVCFAWTIGGYWIVKKLFNLDPWEELIVGFATGMVAYLFFVNILARFLPPLLGFTLPALLVLGLGLISCYHQIPHPFHRESRAQWFLIITGIMMGIFFLLISLGVSLYDEYRNLPIIAQMARGTIPPTFNSLQPYSYHYGSQLLGSSFVAIGGMFPWSAFDFEKGILWGLTGVLFILVAKRYLKSWYKSAIACLFYTFVGGTRYLLFFFPKSWLAEVDKLVTLQGTSTEIGLPLSQALRQQWTLDGGPVQGSYTFGFMNGLFSNRAMAHDGTGEFSIMILLLFILFLQRERSRWVIVLYTTLLAYWALVNEANFGLFGIGLGLAGLYMLIKDRRKFYKFFEYTWLPGLLSLPLAFTQGGVFSGQSITFLSNNSVASNEGTLSFGLKLLASVETAHLGNLPINNIYTILVLVVEMGLGIFFLPWILPVLWKRMKDGEWLSGILLGSTLFAFIAPFFIGFKGENSIPSTRDISRLTGFAVDTWAMVLIILFLKEQKWKFYRILAGGALGVMSVGGIYNLWRELPAIEYPVNSYYVKDPDVEVARDVWEFLPDDCQIFDPNGERALIITGCKTNHNYLNSYKTRPEWQSIRDNPTLEELGRQGYDFIYMNEKWLMDLPEGNRGVFRDPCVIVISRHFSEDGFLRRDLLDISSCGVK